MQQITISGTLLSDAEKCIDRNENTYTRFDVACGETDMNGRSQYTHYHCTCYVGGFEGMKKGDQVFLTGKLTARITQDRYGKSYLNLNVMVYQVAGGYRVNERKTQK